MNAKQQKKMTLSSPFESTLTESWNIITQNNSQRKKNEYATAFETHFFWVAFFYSFSSFVYLRLTKTTRSKRKFGAGAERREPRIISLFFFLFFPAYYDKKYNSIDDGTENA